MIALVPLDDLEEHEIYSVDCKCQPTLKIEVNGDMLLVHNSFDGREPFEIDNPVRLN